MTTPARWSSSSAAVAPTPDVSSAMHLASVDYACTFGELGGGLVIFAAPDPVHFTFSFETGHVELAPGVVQVTTDYSWFNQGTVEQDITSAMESICVAISSLLGISLVTVRAASQVQRVWLYRPNILGGGWSSGAINSTDIFYWNPYIADSDVSQSDEEGSVSFPPSSP